MAYFIHWNYDIENKSNKVVEIPSAIGRSDDKQKEPRARWCREYNLFVKIQQGEKKAEGRKLSLQLLN